MFEKLHNYVSAVSKGNIVGDGSVARSIENTLSLIPEQATEFDNLFSKGTFLLFIYFGLFVAV
jgi:hypothetical protein